MTDYAKIKKLDEESLQRLKEGSGPADDCLCSLLSPHEEKKGFAASVKRVFGALSGRKKGTGWPDGGQRSGQLPTGFSRDAPGFHSTKEVVTRQRSCGKCGCDNDKLVLKHSYANIRITTPDVSSICPCPSDCLPDKDKLQNNIKVIVENAQINAKPAFRDGAHIEELAEKEDIENNFDEERNELKLD